MIDVLCESASELDGATDSVVKKLAAGGPQALAATKNLLNELDGSLDEAIVLKGAQLSASVLATPDAQARLRAKLGA